LASELPVCKCIFVLAFPVSKSGTSLGGKPHLILLQMYLCNNVKNITTSDVVISPAHGLYMETFSVLFLIGGQLPHFVSYFWQ
jgi:hypothetical protein